MKQDHRQSDQCPMTRFVPDPVAVTVWPGLKVVPCAGEVRVVEAEDVTVRVKLVVLLTPPPAPVTVIV